ncbi:SMI1/KNR4 family protein [Pseudoalteromonas luteoviolacea]|uniref:SMI1/KNR4 family protein n=1 Tax=Pseudoalteromonas luteoviolacea TaxID=43657 RepID=UPI001B386736|nr:SMI1/KNR4 family protein [Pseudoalteromonas luteoviolacea]MBQ4839601.1 SMI1/KNR4 family protein [Pseudoalteromonas luteoviolacea]
MNESQVLMSKLLGPRDPANLNCVGFSARDIDEILKYAPPLMARYSQFLTFLSVMGLEDGGLLDSGTFFHFSPKQSFLNLRLECENLYEIFLELRSLPKEGCYLLEINGDEYYYFDFDKKNQHVYVYNDKTKSIRDSGWDFFAYLDNRCAVDKSQFHHNKRCTLYREVLTEQLPAVKPAPTKEQVTGFLSLLNHEHAYPRIDELKGYDMQEIARLEAVYNIEVSEELLLYLYTMGRNQAGLIAPIPKGHCDWISYFYAMTELRELLEEYYIKELAEELYIFEMDEELDNFLFYSKSDGGVYYLNNNMERLEIVYKSISEMLFKTSKSIEKHGMEDTSKMDDSVLLFDLEAGSLY